MIGAFARKLGPHDRVPTTDEIQTQSQPPEGFVEKFPHEGGDVFVSPIVETLRAVLRSVRSRRADEGAPAATAAATLPHVSENR